jgi:RNA polymerase sigma-70 factor (ECF subfamily)
MGSNSHIEDLLQDSFVEIFRSLGSYRGEARLTTWADRVAARVAYRHFAREKKRRLSASAAVELCLVGSAEDDVMHREGLRRVYRVLGELKPSQRIAFTLFAIDGRSLKEVADTMDASLVATKSRVWRARRELAAAARSDTILASYLSAEERTNR